MNEIFRDYLIFLAAIPSISGFLGLLFDGSNFFVALVWCVLYYILSLAGVWFSFKIISYLATNFNVIFEDISLFKLIAYSYTAFFVAGIFYLIPKISYLSFIGLYGFFVYNIGQPILVDCPDKEKFNYTFISIVAILLTLTIVYTVSYQFSGLNYSYMSYLKF